MLQFELANRGLSVSVSTIHRVVKALGRTYQAVSWRTPPRDMSRELVEFFVTFDELVRDGANIMSVDETGVLSNRYTLRGYGMRGERLRVIGPQQKRFKVTSTVAITSYEYAIMQTVEGNANGQTFQSFMKAALADAPPNTVVILDNISFHKSRAVRQIAEEHGVRLMFTPSYSPECNPVEHFFSAFKTVMKRVLLVRRTSTPREFADVVRTTLDDVVDGHRFEGYFGQRIRERRPAIHSIA